MKTNAYMNRASVATTATTTAAKPLPIVSRALNLTHDPAPRYDKNGDVYVALNTRDTNNKPFKVMLFGKAAKAALEELTVGDFVEFTGRQGTWEKEYEGKTYSGISVKVDYADKACVPYRVLAASQDKAKAKSEREAAKAKAEAGLQAKIHREAELY